MKTALMMATVLAMVSGGCVIVGDSGAFRSDGLPKQQYYVGGGFMIEYEAPSPGTLYVVEKTSIKFIVTKSLDEGEVFELSLDPTDTAGLEKIGIDPLDVKFCMYFVPSEGTEEVSEE
ncbi:MAG: hypothetical protein ACYSO4_02940 [Planctomycetota bacterium]|jgi:hypothetical protein